MAFIYLKFVGPRNAYFPGLGANADWSGEDEAEAKRRIATGFWQLDEEQGAPQNEELNRTPEHDEEPEQPATEVATDEQEVAKSESAELLPVAAKVRRNRNK